MQPDPRTRRGPGPDKHPVPTTQQTADHDDHHQGTALVLDLGEWRRLTRAERERGLRHVRALRAQLRQVAS